MDIVSLLLSGTASDQKPEASPVADCAPAPDRCDDCLAAGGSETAHDGARSAKGGTASRGSQQSSHCFNGLRPDLVLFGGDYATDHQSAVQFFQKLRSGEKIRSRYGAFGVVGETDRGESDFDLTELTEAMTNADVEPLVNRSVSVNIGAARIYIAGLDDATAGKPDLKTVSRSVSASDYVIFLAHNPSVIPDAQLAKDSSGNLGWFDLGLFGHTHGGQMLFFSSLLGIADDIPERYKGGWLKENRADLLVSRGVGTSVYPGRLFCLPQIHYIEVSY